MADRTNDERLRYHATRSWTAFDAGTYDELQAIAAELLAARAQLREVAASGVEAECRQYVTVQISPETWAKLQEVARE